MGFLRRGFVFVPPNAPETVGAGVGGFVAANWLTDQLAKQFTQVATGWPRILAKAGIACGIYAIGKSFIPRNYATGAAVGGLISAGLDVYNKFKAQGMSGLGYAPGGIDYGQEPMQALTDASEIDLGQLDEIDLVDAEAA